jgi:hypothetical protein
VSERPRLLLPMLCCATMIGCAQAPAGETAQAQGMSDDIIAEIAAVDGLLRDAEVRGDTAAAGRLIAQEFTWIAPAGNTMDRQQRMQMIAAGERALGPLVRTDFSVRRYGDSALGVWRAPTSGGGPDVWVTRVYAQRDARWQLVHQHGSSISR